MIDKINARDLRQTPFSNPTQVFTNKINEVINELNRQGESIQGLAFAEIPPKKEETPIKWKVDKDLTVYRLIDEAVEAYKKRLLGKLKAEEAGIVIAGKWDEGYQNGFYDAIELVEETD